MAQKVASVYAEIGADTKGLKRGLDETKSGLQNTAKQMGKFKLDTLAVWGAVGAGVIAAKKAFDFAKEGTQLEFLRGKFDKLAVTVGSSGDKMLSELRKVTRGVVADSELVASAADFMSLGLAKTADQVVRLTRVSGALGMDMNQLVLTLANQTTMRFDQLGVAVDGFDDRLKKLKDTGMDANAAFTEAFLQQAEAQVKKVGEVADTNAGKVKKMEVAWKNLGDTWKLRVAPAAAYLAEQLLGLLPPTADQIDYNLVQIKTVKGVERAYIEYAGSLRDVTEEYRAWQAIQEKSIPQWQQYTREVEEGTTAVKESGQAAERSWGQFYALSGAIRKGAEASDVATPKFKSLLDGLDRDITSPLAEFRKDLEWFQAGGSNLTRKFDEIKAAVEAGEISAQDAKGMIDKLFIGVVDLQEEIGHITAEEAADKIAEQFGISAKEAAAWLMGTQGPYQALSAITSQEWYVDIFYREHNKPGVLGGGGKVGELYVEPGLVPDDGGAHGLSGLVPSGFPADSYLIGATSGEHVEITPQGKPTSGGDVYVVQNFYDQGAAALGMAYVETLRGQRLDASMGR